MRHSIKHSLTPDQLRLAVRKFAEVYCERFKEYQTSVSWLNEDELEVSFKVTGMRLTGTLSLEPHELGIDMKVPFAFTLFKGRAIRAIEEEVTPWLDKASRGELDAD